MQAEVARADALYRRTARQSSCTPSGAKMSW